MNRNREICPVCGRTKDHLIEWTARTDEPRYDLRNSSYFVHESHTFIRDIAFDWLYGYDGFLTEC